MADPEFPVLANKPLQPLGEGGREAAKEEASTAQTRAGTAKTIAETEKLDVTLPAIQTKTDAEAVTAAYNAANLGFAEANKEFQKQYIAWRSGEADTFFEDLKQLKKAVRILRSGKQITGAVFNQLPDFIKRVVSPESADVRAAVEKVVQRELRKTLGAQFTQAEGDRFLARVFDPALPEEFVADKVDSELTSIIARGKSLEAMSRYYEQNSTIKGYNPSEWLPQVEEDFKVMEGISEREQDAAEAMNYRDAMMSNPAGEPLRGWRFRRGEEQQLINYANSADFTPEGFVDMMSEMVVLASGQEPDRAALMAEAKEIAKRPEGQRLGSIDYSKVDEAAAKNAGFSEVAIQALKNVPESSFNLVSGLVAPVGDAVRSAILGERVGTIETFPDLIADVASKAGIGETDEATINALAEVLEDRYGSVAGLKRAAASDPVGIVGDLSIVLTLGGSATARAPGVVGRAGQRVAQVGQAIDPLSFAGNLTARGVNALPPSVKALPGRATTELLSTTTGAPRSAFSQAFERGAGRQRVGVTPLTEQFRTGMSGGILPEDLVTSAKTAMQEMREAAGREYRSGMVDISKDKSVLSFDELDKALADMRRDATYKGEVVKPDVLATLDDMEAIINDWRVLDPAEFHTPEGFDKLKQRLFEVTENVPLDDRTRRRAAGAVYNATKDTIRAQAPTYSAVMDQYADAQTTLARMENELGLGRAPIDTAAAKLTQRPPSRKGRDDLLSLLADYDPKLAAGVAGEQLSTYAPSGLRRVGAGLAGTLGAIGNISTLGLISPRLMGDATYLAGRASVPLTEVIDFAKQNPTALLAAQRAVALSEATEKERNLQELLDRYGVTVPYDPEMARDVSPDTLRLLYEEPSAEPFSTPELGFEPQYRDIDPETGEIIERNYAMGGLVKKYGEGGLVDFLPDAEDVKGFGRAVGEGLLFGYNDEVEAYLRALAQDDPDAFQREVDKIRREQIQYAQDHPGWALAGNATGMVGTAFIPGAQGLSAARLASMGPKARAAYELGLGAGQGALYGTGKMYDEPDSERDPLAVLVTETAAGSLGYPVTRGVTAVGRRVVPQGAKDFVVRKGRELFGTRRRARR